MRTKSDDFEKAICSLSRTFGRCSLHPVSGKSVKYLQVERNEILVSQGTGESLCSGHVRKERPVICIGRRPAGHTQGNS